MLEPVRLGPRARKATPITHRELGSMKQEDETRSIYREQRVARRLAMEAERRRLDNQRARDREAAQARRRQS